MKQHRLSPLLPGLCLLLAACGQTTSQPPAAPPPAEVAVLEVHPESVPLIRELVGRLAPTRVAEVRARVAGIILERVYTEGTDVAQDAVLYRIDPAPLEATLHAHEAALARARADATNAAATAKRYRELRRETADLDPGPGQRAGQRTQHGGGRQAGPGRRGKRAPGSGLRHRHRTDRRTRRALAGHRGRPGGPGRGDPADHHRTDRSPVHKLQPVGDRAA